MPVFEYGCYPCGNTVEEFRHPRNVDDPVPPCPECGADMVKLISTFSMPFVGAITAKYNDRTKEGAHQDGHWAYAMRTPDGKPKPVFIETWDQQKSFCSQEGLVNPKDLPTNAEATSDRTLSSRGMPGQWV